MLRRCLIRSLSSHRRSSTLPHVQFRSTAVERSSHPPPLTTSPTTISRSLSTQTRTLATHATLTSTAAGGPTHAYDHQVGKGIIQNDPHQRSIVALLQTMYDSLETYSPQPVPDPLAAPPKPSFFQTLFHSASSRTASVPYIDPAVPKGLYLYGSVGCGKSFLMDLFYANLPSQFNGSKRRVHFHAFMMDVHQRGHRMKNELGDRADWIVPIARELAQEARILCFDEFQVRLISRPSNPLLLANTSRLMNQVTDIADAMILRRLMESLMGYGVVAVMTSK